MRLRHPLPTSIGPAMVAAPQLDGFAPYTEALCYGYDTAVRSLRADHNVPTPRLVHPDTD